MRQMLIAFLVLVVAGACSEEAGPETTEESVDFSLPPIEFDCARIVGSTWRSLDLLTGGEAPGGGTTREHWQIEFKEGEARWWHTDVVLDLAYRCDDGELSAGEPWREINPKPVADGDRLLLRWNGDLYRRVDSFYDIP